MRWRQLSQSDRLDLLALEYERYQMKRKLLKDYPKDDWTRNLATLTVALD